jgi:hypothetical protein
LPKGQLIGGPGKIPGLICQKLPVGLKARLVRSYQQLQLVEDQISILATEKREQLKQVDNVKMRQVAQLLRLPGIGPVS